MSDTPKVATPHDALIAQLLDPNEPKTEREHAAARELAAAKADVERLLSVVQSVAATGLHKLPGGDECLCTRCELVHEARAALAKEKA
jgi:hypothetical protein